jgi:PAS domain S-box-containing protein
VIREDVVLDRELDGRFELLLSQSVCPVLVTELDQPILWNAASDHDALLDYAFEHLRIVAVNNAMCVQLDATREQLIGRTASEQWREDPVRWREHARALFDQGRLCLRDRLPRGNGTWLDVEGEFVCTYDREGRITGAYALRHNVSVERAMALELATSEQRLELAIFGAGIGIWDVDLPERSVVFGQRWLERYGYAPDEISHDWSWWASIIHPEDVARTQAAFGDHVAGKTPWFRVEYRMRTASGEWSWILSTGKVTARDGAGNALRVVGICVDTTERKHLDERLVASERLVALGTLAAGVGHEISTPLTHVGLNLTLLEREVSALQQGDTQGLERIREMIEQSRSSVARVGVIVGNLQSLARRRDEQVMAVDLVPVLERCLEIADHQIRHRARVMRELGATPKVLSTEGRMVQLFLNLIVNAAQAIPEGAADRYWIRVTSTTSPDGRVVVEVSDNGLGIATSDLARVFDPFFTTKPLGSGTGLGLTICRNIVAGVGGDVEIDSALGRGTTLRVTLPASQEAERAATPTMAPSVSGVRVLVIDDEPIIGKVIAAVLDGCEVIAETSGRLALARIRSGEQFDRILCDVMMPEVTGMDVYEQLPPEARARVVFLTGGAFTDRARNFLERVPNRRLHKPFDVEQLAAALAD